MAAAKPLLRLVLTPCQIKGGCPIFSSKLSSKPSRNASSPSKSSFSWHRRTSSKSMPLSGTACISLLNLSSKPRSWSLKMRSTSVCFKCSRPQMKYFSGSVKMCHEPNCVSRRTCPAIDRTRRVVLSLRPAARVSGTVCRRHLGLDGAATGRGRTGKLGNTSPSSSSNSASSAQLSSSSNSATSCLNRLRAASAPRMSSKSCTSVLGDDVLAAFAQADAMGFDPELLGQRPELET
mmetsp:Transcript_24117/g.45548  ORF Transcript_24117/g.45548 Transcript_24117/m.45548 type:complete len:235 (-) Transcript_24117:22-726(-)